MVKVYTPSKGESTRHIHMTKEDRISQGETFRERKAAQDKIKKERFTAIQKRRDQRSGGSGGKINITVESDPK